MIGLRFNKNDLRRSLGNEYGWLFQVQENSGIHTLLIQKVRLRVREDGEIRFSARTIQNLRPTKTIERNLVSSSYTVTYHDCSSSNLSAFLGWNGDSNEYMGLKACFMHSSSIRHLVSTTIDGNIDFVREVVSIKTDLMNPTPISDQYITLQMKGKVSSRPISTNVRDGLFSYSLGIPCPPIWHKDETDYRRVAEYCASRCVFPVPLPEDFARAWGLYLRRTLKRNGVLKSSYEKP